MRPLITALPMGRIPVAQYKVAELFESINGEGPFAGQLAVFVRFKGCNLSCTYCDTAWANEPEAFCRMMTEAEIYQAVKETGIKNVTLTGGEPLIQPDILTLLAMLLKDGNLRIEIETNGSVNLREMKQLSPLLSFTMDYKLPASGMEKGMFPDNFHLLTENDTVKFVAGSKKDLLRAKEIIEQYDLTNKCRVYISTVFGSLDLKEVVDFMKEKRLNGVTLQLQLHKIIWGEQARGV